MWFIQTSEANKTIKKSALLTFPIKEYHPIGHKLCGNKKGRAEQPTVINWP